MDDVFPSWLSAGLHRLASLKLWPIALAVLVALVYAAGDYFIKCAAKLPDSLWTASFAIGALLYAVSAIGWLFAMKHLSLATIAVYFSMFEILFLALLGAMVFEEALSGRHLVGIACALLAVVLMSHAP